MQPGGSKRKSFSFVQDSTILILSVRRVQKYNVHKGE